MFFKTTKPLPSGQEWLLNRMSKIGYSLEDGACFGASGMTMQAFFLRELPQLKRRLDIINSIPLNEFKKTIDYYRDKRINIIKQIKDLVNSQQFDKNTKLLQIENKLSIKNKINILEKNIKESVASGKINKLDEQMVQKKQRDTLIYNALIQEKFAEEMRSLSDDEKLAFDIRIFLEDVKLTQEPDEYSEIFGELLLQDYVSILPYISAKKLELKGGITKASSFCGIYNVKECITIFENFALLFSQIKPTIVEPIAFALHSNKHTIIVGYDPIIKKWHLINANNLELLTKEMEVTELANYVIPSFSTNGLAAFETEIYCYQNDLIPVTLCIQSFKKESNWQSIHSTTKQQALANDSNFGNWLLIAANFGHVKIVKALLKAGANPNSIDDQGNTPLNMAIYRRHTKVVKCLLKSNIKADPNHIDKQGNTPLYIAAQTNQLEVIKLLLAKGANPDFPSQVGATPLMIATEVGHIEVVKVLLTKGANPNAACDDKMTSLYIAAQNGQTDILKFLLANGANPNARCDNGATPLFIAAEQGYIEIVEQLLARGAHADARLDDGSTPLFIAAQNGHSDIVKCLLAAGVNADSNRNDGATPISIAAQKGHSQIVQELSRHGVDHKKALPIASTYLRKFAKDIGVEENKNTFPSTQSSLKFFAPRIAIRPKEMNSAKGQHDTANLQR